MRNSEYVFQYISSRKMGEKKKKNIITIFDWNQHLIGYDIFFYISF